MEKKEITGSNLNDKEITYDKLLILFMIGCMLGVLLEGSFCLITKGHWESHVVSIIGAFNTLYGAGMVFFLCWCRKTQKQTYVYKSYYFNCICHCFGAACRSFIKIWSRYACMEL